MSKTQSIVSDDNPFDLTKATDFSDHQILDYWVDLTGNAGGLMSVLKPRLLMPMLLLGGKGSGKTHLMRFCSSPVQAMRHGGDLCAAVQAEGYLGIYLRTDGLNIGRFAGKGQSNDVWMSIFGYALELWFILNLVSSAIPIFKAKPLTAEQEKLFVDGVAPLFDTNVEGKFGTVGEFESYIYELQKHLDFAVNNVALTRSLNSVTIAFTPGKMLFGIPQVLSRVCPGLASAVFVYLVDEMENLTADQQRFVNSLIRYRHGNTTIKIGARLYGVKTYETLGSGEPIKRDAEYERVELDSILRDRQSDYAMLARTLIAKRLQQRHFSATPFNAYEVDKFFESPDRTDYYRSTALSIVRKRDKNGHERPHIEKLKGHLESAFGSGCSKEIKAIISQIRVKDHPLLEKLNVFLLYRAWGSIDRMLVAAKSISAESKAFLGKGRGSSVAYEQVLDHFSSDLLAQLYRECGKKNVYAGLDTLIHLSQGVPRNLLGILKQIYRRSVFLGEKPFTDASISLEAQNEGVLDASAWFWDDAQPDSNGVDVRQAIDSLAVLFRRVRYSLKPSECDVCTFSAGAEHLSEAARKTIEVAENWSYLIKVRDGSKNKNYQRVDIKYQLSPMLAPRWGVSEHRRGNFELQPDIVNAIFDKSQRPLLENLLDNRLKGMESLDNGFNEKQQNLFGQ